MPWEVVHPKKLSFWIYSMYGIFSVAFGVYKCVCKSNVNLIKSI